MSQCKTCGSKLGARNASGYCRHHFKPALIDPTWAEKQKAGIRKALADPVKLEGYRDRARAAFKVPGAREARIASAKRIGLHKIGHKALEGDLDARRRAGAHRTATVFKDIPREQWDCYRELVRFNRMSAAEARQMVLDKHELEMARFRREIGAPAVDAVSGDEVRQG